MHQGQGRQHHEGGRCDVGMLREALPVILYQKKSAIVGLPRFSPYKPRHMPDQTTGVPIIN